MKIFISSTCYNLTDLRAEIETFLIKKGHELLLSDRANFPVKMGIHRHDVCIENVEKADLFILIIDGRFGAPYYKNGDISITWAEFNQAIASNINIIPFVRTSVFDERQTYNHNKKLGNPFSPWFAEDNRVFDFISEVQKNEGGFWIQQFNNSVQIKDRLENLYDTNHSLLNYGPVSASYDPNNIPISAVSGSTGSYITQYVTHNSETIINEDILIKAISLIPEKKTMIGEFLGSEAIPSSNEFVNYIPLKYTGDEGEMIIGISPTALGDAVRKEMEDIIKNFNKNTN